MNEDTADLVARLCTEAGMILEDASALALAAAMLTGPNQRAALLELNTAARRATALLSAAAALADTSDNDEAAG